MARNPRESPSLRPASVAIHNDGDMQSRLRHTLQRKAIYRTLFTLHCKVTSQNFLCPQWVQIAQQTRPRLVFRQVGCVFYHLLQGGEVLEVAFAAVGSDSAHGLRPVPVMPFQDLNQLCLLQSAQVPAEITVGKRAHLLQIVERQRIGVSDERGQYAQASALMDDAIESFVSEAPFAGRRFRLHCRPPSPQRKEPTPPAIARRQMG